MRDRSKRKPNVRDVARQAGVSPATVSRVMNRSALVSKTKRDQVEAAIDALNFVPSSAARAINSGHTRLVGALIPTLDHAIYARFIEAIEAELDLRGLSLIVAVTDGDTAREFDKAKRLLDIGVEGLIVSGITRAGEFEALVKRHQVPVISTSYFDADYTYPTIGYDNAQVARTALEHLTALGHRSIAVVSGPTHNNDRTGARLQAIVDASDTPLVVVQTALTFEAAVRATTHVLEDHPQITALLCLSDVIAQASLLCVRAKGLQVPSEISVIGIDDLPSSASFDPPLTTMHLPVADMGKKAARAMAEWIDTDIQPGSVKLSSVLIVRQSTQIQQA